MISGDYHIHSRYSGLSHGKNTISELKDAASKIGLSEIGIADHGLKHLFFGTSEKRLAKAREEADALNAAQEQGARVLLGLEADLISLDGLLDCKDMACLDYVAMGYHKLAAAPSAAQAHKFALPGAFSFQIQKRRFYARVYKGDRKISAQLCHSHRERHERGRRRDCQSNVGLRRFVRA